MPTGSQAQNKMQSLRKKFQDGVWLLPTRPEDQGVGVFDQGLF